MNSNSIKFCLSGSMFAFWTRERAVEVLKTAQLSDPFEVWNSKLDTANPGKLLKKELMAVVMEITMPRKICANQTIQLTDDFSVF